MSGSLFGLVGASYRRLHRIYTLPRLTGSTPVVPTDLRMKIRVARLASVTLIHRSPPVFSFGTSECRAHSSGLLGLPIAAHAESILLLDPPVVLLQFQGLLVRPRYHFGVAEVHLVTLLCFENANVGLTNVGLPEAVLACLMLCQPA